MTIRTNQRARTRQALIDAAQSLLDDGNTTPSMDEIAEAALVSRATAYRYFDAASEVIWNAAADHDLEPVGDAFADGCTSVRERVLRAERINNDYLFGDPDGARAFEHAALERTLTGVASPDDRPARRLSYIDAALEPIADQLDPDVLRRLRYSLALTIGSQTVPALLDTCGLDVDEAREVTRFAAQAIVSDVLRKAGIDEAGIDEAGIDEAGIDDELNVGLHA